MQISRCRHSLRRTPLLAAGDLLTRAKVEILVEAGADYKKVLIDRSEDTNGEKLYIANVLREQLFPLGSPQHQMKTKVVAFLKKKGIDYHKTPIPDFIQKKAKADYPDNWKEYLQKY